MIKAHTGLSFTTAPLQARCLNSQNKRQHTKGAVLCVVRETGLGLVAATQSRGLISTLLRSSVNRGSDSPPDCHSLPLRFKPVV